MHLRIYSRAAYWISLDVGKQVEEVLDLGSNQPLSQEEAYSLMTKVISILKRNVARRGDKEAEQKLDVDVETFAHALVGVRTRPRTSQPEGDPEERRVHLIEYDGIKPASVRPAPYIS